MPLLGNPTAAVLYPGKLLYAALPYPWAARLYIVAHTLLAIVIVVGSAVHAILIEGTMETVSKAALCALVLAAAIKVIADLRVWRKRATSRAESIARQ